MRAVLLLIPLVLAAAALPAGSRPARALQPRGTVEATMSKQAGDLEAVVAGFRGRMGVAAIDLRSGRTIAINADERFPTASTIKTAVMIEAWQQAADGRLSMDTLIPLKKSDRVGGAGVLQGMHEGLELTVGDLVHLMIVLSDNTATNLLIERLGTARVNARLDSSRAA